MNCDLFINSPFIRESLHPGVDSKVKGKLEQESALCKFKNGQNEKEDEKNSNDPPNDHSAVHHNGSLSNQLRQVFSELFARAVNARFNCLNRALQYRSDLRLGQILVLGEDKRDAQFLGEIGNGLADNL